MQRLTSFVHLTDLHLGAPDDPHLHSDTAAALAAALAEIARITPAPDFIVASGDLINAGDEGSYRRLRRLMAAVPCPVVYALGNHDTRAGFRAGMLDAPGDAPLDHDAAIAGVHVIALDSTLPGEIGGDLDAGQLGWLAAVLARHADLPKLIVCHHPPALDDRPSETPWRMLPVETSARLAAALAPHRVLAILSGHIHHDRFSLWHGVPVIVGTGLHAATDILDTENLRMLRAGAFGFGTVRASGLTMAVIPLPSDRAELFRYPMAALRARAAAR
ncbi:MAG: metallophosphoesterase [Gemmobacter sp.]